MFTASPFLRKKASPSVVLPEESAAVEEVKQETKKKTYHELNIFNNLRISVAKLENQLCQKLEQLLAPEVYQQVIRDGKKDADGRYQLVTTDTQDILFYYQSILNLLIDFQLVMEPVSDLHETFTKFQKSIMGKVKILWSEGADINEQVNRLSLYYCHFLNSIQALKLDMVFGNLPALEDLQSFLKWFVPIKTMEAQWANNPFIDSYKQHGNEWRQLLGLSRAQPEPELDDEGKIEAAGATEKTLQVLQEMPRYMDNMKAALKQILCDLSGGEVSESVRKDYKDTVELTNKILDKINRYAQRTPSWGELIRFIYEVYPTVKALIASLPQSYVSLNKMLKEHLLTTAYQINLIIRAWFLCIDRLESQCYMKEGYLLTLGEGASISLSKLATEFNSWIENLGYEFKPEERYPYTQDIIIQREKLLKEANEEKDSHPFKTELLLKRLNTQIEYFEDQKGFLAASKKSQEASLIIYKQRIMALQIDKRIGELRAEIMQSWILLTDRKKKKIKLLNEIKNNLDNSSYKDYRTILDETKNRKDFHWLEEGRTGTLMQTLQLVVSKPADRLAFIAQELTKLQQSQREAKNYYFFRSRREERLMKRMRALKVLHEWLEQPGYRVNEVLDLISAKTPEHYWILIQHEYALLAKLKEIDDYTPDFVLGKKSVHFSAKMFKDSARLASAGSYPKPPLSAKSAARTPFFRQASSSSAPSSAHFQKQTPKP